MAIDVGFKILNIAVIKEAGKHKMVPEVGTAKKKETVGVEVLAAFSYFNSNTVGPICQSSSTFKFI